MNGPIITDWLQRLLNRAKPPKSLILLYYEVYGLSVDFTKLPKSHAQQAYGTIGCLWRESVHQYLREGEDAIPLNGVSHIQKMGKH